MSDRDNEAHWKLDDALKKIGNLHRSIAELTETIKQQMAQAGCNWPSCQPQDFQQDLASQVVASMQSGHRPCPFCGGKVDPDGWMGWHKGAETTGPECEGCGATAPTIEMWDTRK
jgi:hypothetical protein